MVEAVEEEPAPEQDLLWGVETLEEEVVVAAVDQVLCVEPHRLLSLEVQIQEEVSVCGSWSREREGGLAMSVKCASLSPHAHTHTIFFQDPQEVEEETNLVRVW